MCKSYPCINTSFCTNTTPTGADKANGPSHYQQLPGGKGVRNWYLITQDRWVLQTTTGYQLELMQVPYQIRPSSAIQCSSEEKHKVSQEVQELLKKGAIVEAQLTQGSFVSQIFLLERKEGGLRPIVNLKNLNCFIQTEHFKMEGLHTLPDLIQSQNWMIKMDLKDAFLQIPVCQEHQHLQFQWNATIYQFNCLPFGLTSAPRVFTKVLKPVVGTLRRMGICLIVYLDDILIMHQSKEELMQLTPLICRFFTGLGWVVNLKKSHLTPEQSVEFLGFMVNSLTMKLILPAQKLKKIQQDAQRLLKLERVSVRELARFLGKVSAASRAVWQAPFHYRPLQRMVNAVIPESQSQPDLMQKFNVQAELTKEAMEDLSWWASLGSTMIESPLHPRIPQLTIESPLHPTPAGAHVKGICLQAVYGPQRRQRTISAFLVVQCFAKEQHQVTILLRLDNVIAMTFINKMGGTHSEPLCQLALSLWQWCLEREIFLVAVHLPGLENVVADQESRAMRDRCDWMLDSTVFKQIQAQMGPCEVDLFASHLTKQLPQFYRWRPDPEAEGVDAFNQDWSQVRGFANPPWCLISPCLAQVKRQQARVVLITPLWNTQPWYPVLLELLEDCLCWLQSQGNLVKCPSTQDFTRDSDSDCMAHLRESFASRGLSSEATGPCYPHGDKRQNVATTPLSQNGRIGVSKGIEILLLDL